MFSILGRANLHHVPNSWRLLEQPGQLTVGLPYLQVQRAFKYICFGLKLSFHANLESMGVAHAWHTDKHTKDNNLVFIIGRDRFSWISSGRKSPSPEHNITSLQASDVHYCASSQYLPAYPALGLPSRAVQVGLLRHSLALGGGSLEISDKTWYSLIQATKNSIAANAERSGCRIVEIIYK